MKYVVIRWQDRLDDLYFIAGETGGNFESCDNEWDIDWLPKIKKDHGKGCSFEIEPIPEQELRELIEYCDAPEGRDE